MDLDNKYNTVISQKRVIGEKKRSYWRTGLKLAGGLLGGALLGALGSKLSGGNNVPIQQGGGTGNQLIDNVLQQQGKLPPRIEVSQSENFSAVV